jgi:hypothetical protein
MRPADSTGGAASPSPGIWKRVACALGIAGCAWLWAATASAAPTVPARLLWQGSVCGTAEDFAARVSERTDAVRFVRKGPRLTVRLRIARRRAGLAASVVIEARGSAPLRRRLESPDCEDALDALALVVAIGIEGRSSAATRFSAAKAKKPAMVEPPSASAEVRSPAGAPAPRADSGPLSPSSPSESESPVASGEAASPPPTLPGPHTSTAPDGTSAPAPSALGEAPQSGLTPQSGLAPPVGTPETRDPELDSPRRAGSVAAAAPFRLGAGVSARLSFGIAPDPMLGGAVWVAASWEREGAWSPGLVLSAMHQRLEGLSIENGEVDFSLSAAAVEACPLRLGRSALAVRPCVEASFGRLSAEAHDTYDPQSKDRPWGALGGALELTAALGAVELRASVAASAPLVRDGFRFGARCLGSACEADVFHRVASMIWSGAAGAGVVFW